MGRNAKNGKQNSLRNAAAEGATERVHVTVHSMAGNTLEFHLAKDRNILSVKKRASREWLKPLSCLKVCSHGLALDDADRITNYCDEQARAHFCIITSTAALYIQLGHDCVQLRLDAIEDLKVLAENNHFQHAGQEQFARAMCSCLEDDNISVRQAAVNAIDVAISKGDVVAVAEVILRLHNPKSNVRQSSMNALNLVAERGNVCAINALLPLLNDPVIAVRCKAAEVIANVSDQGDDRVIQALYAKLDDPTPPMTIFVAESLGRVACQGDSDVMQKLARRALKENSQGIACALTDAICDLASRGDEGAVQILLDIIIMYERLSKLEYCHGKAWYTLARIARPDDGHVFNVLDRLCQRSLFGAGDAMSCFQQRARQTK